MPGRTTLGETGLEVTGPEQAGPEQTGPEQAGPEQIGPGQTGPGQTGLDQTGVALGARQRALKLGVAWETRGQAFRSSLLTLLHGPAPPRGWPLGPFFRDSWLRARPPWKMLTASALWHVLAVVLPIWVWSVGVGSAPRPPAPYEISWSGSIKDLLPYLPSGPRSKARPDSFGAGQRSTQHARKGADAFHPRQTIVSAPPNITHPRQTLIQPDAPLAPPKILPALPNVAQWTPPTQPTKPSLHMNTSERIRAHIPKARPVEPLPAPDTQKAPTLTAEVIFTTAAPNVARPRLEVRRTAAPRFRARSAAQEQSTPEPDASPSVPIGTGAERLVALSANPAPPPPRLEVPQGNLSARFAISPDGKQPGVPGGASAAADPGDSAAGGGLGAGKGMGQAGGGGKGPGIPGVSIAGGSPDSAGTISGSGSGLTPMLSSRPKLLPLEPTPRGEATTLARPRTDSLLDRIKPGSPPENILEPGRIYTLHVNMPNLSSVTGSWVLKFTELDEEERKTVEQPTVNDLAGPVPLRKVDPKYPPALATAKIQGEVVLYAIIRRDGSVDSIQLIQGIDPQLDQNAMEALARWKFRAAERQGKPVELETIVRIPFRAVSSIY